MTSPHPSVTDPGATDHGGSDAGPPIAHDFSTNANAAGPAPAVLAAVMAADRRRYPDPGYHALRTLLSARLRVSTGRLVLAASGSEAILRMTLAASLHGVRAVHAPQPGYGDYARAATGLGLRAIRHADPQALAEAVARQASPSLVWTCEPCNPTGASMPAEAWTHLFQAIASTGSVLAIDRAYEPLRLHGADPVPAAVAAHAWQCWSWNKACGLTGVRAAYVVAPVDADSADDGVGAKVVLRGTLERLAPSWVLGAEGAAFLEAATDDHAQAWLAGARQQLRAWERAQRDALRSAGWTLQPSTVPFFLATPPWPHDAFVERLATLRHEGIKLRDAAGFGLAGQLRLSVQPPASQRALMEALARLETRPARRPEDGR